MKIKNGKVCIKNLLKSLNKKIFDIEKKFEQITRIKVEHEKEF